MIESHNITLQLKVKPSHVTTKAIHTQKLFTRSNFFFNLPIHGFTATKHRIIRTSFYAHAVKKNENFRVIIIFLNSIQFQIFSTDKSYYRSILWKIYSNNISSRKWSALDWIFIYLFILISSNLIRFLIILCYRNKACWICNWNSQNFWIGRTSILLKLKQLDSDTSN